MPHDPMATMIGQAGAVFLDIDEMEEILSFGPAVVYVADVTGDYAARDISPNVETQTGYMPSDFIDDANFWASHIHPEDAPRILDGLQNLFEHDHHTHEYRFRLKDGSYRWMHDEMKLIRDPDGEPLKIIGYWTDITERK
jgi:PAS domain S-box-containing protein